MLTGAEQVSDPQFEARGFAIKIDQPGVGPLWLDGAAFRGDHMVGPDVHQAPELGEHTRQIARDLLGRDDAEIDRLLAAGILETTPPASTADCVPRPPERDPLLSIRSTTERNLTWSGPARRSLTSERVWCRSQPPSSSRTKPTGSTPA